MLTPTPTFDTEAAVDRIIRSDLVSTHTADAVLSAIDFARGGTVTIDDCRLAAKRLRAKLRVVAAAFGYVRCVHCGEFVHISAEPDLEDFAACPCCLDVEDDEQEAALCVFVLLSGQSIRPSIAMHAAWAERTKQLTAPCPSTTGQSPAADTET